MTAAVAQENASGADTQSGRVVRVIGPVVDVEFPRGSIPALFNAQDNQKALTEATEKFKAGFVDSDGNRVVNEAEADTLNADEVSQEQVNVTRKTVSK